MSRTIKPITSQKQIDINLTLNKFNGGLVTLVDESLLPANAVKYAKNLMQTQDGRWSVRWGTAYYGVDLGGTIRGAERYVASDNTIHLVVAVDSGSSVTIKRSTDNGATWSTCTGSTLQTGKVCYFLQINNYLYIANSYNSLTRYDGTTTLQPFTSLTTPGAPSPTVTGATGTNYTYYYRITATNSVGETLSSTAGSCQTSKLRSDFTAGTDKITLTWSAVTNAVRYNIYVGEVSGQETFLDSVTGLTYIDDGSLTPNPYVFLPTSDTTAGPTFGPMELSGNRMWGVGDPNNQWRVYWGGTGQYQGYFSPYYGAGYIDLEKGGPERPKKVVHYRDGKGGNFATILTSDPEGNGSIWQVDLQSETVGNTTYTVPVAVKIVGSVGSVAPMSVVKVRNDIMFFNRKGFFTLGSKAQMLNLLSTDEISSNIRPDVRNFKGTLLGSVSGYYYDAKVFYSVPSSGTSTTNDAVYVNDTERRNWSGPWTFGVERFFTYTDTSGSTHLLGTPANGSRLIEISSSIQGDLGQAFQTELITGLLPVSSDRTAFAKIRKAYIELSQPVGPIEFSVLGTEKKKAFSNLDTLTINDTVSNAGIGTQMLGTAVIGDTSITPTVFSRSTVKKVVRINRLLNNIQFQIITNSTTAAYTLLTLQAKGFLVPTRDPNDWRT